MEWSKQQQESRDGSLKWIGPVIWHLHWADQDTYYYNYNTNLEGKTKKIILRTTTDGKMQI